MAQLPSISFFFNCRVTYKWADGQRQSPFHVADLITLENRLVQTQKVRKNRWSEFLQHLPRGAPQAPNSCLNSFAQSKELKHCAFFHHLCSTKVGFFFARACVEKPTRLLAFGFTTGLFGIPSGCLGEDKRPTFPCCPCLSCSQCMHISQPHH